MNPMPVGSETVCALEVAFAAPEQPLLLACRSTLACLSRCLLVTLGDLSAAIVEGRFGRRSSRARFFTRPVGLWTLVWHGALLVAPDRKLGRWKNASSRHSGGGGCFRLYSPVPVGPLGAASASERSIVCAALLTRGRRLAR